MVPMYNIYFEVASTGFLIVLLLYLHIEYPNATESNIRYRRWVAWILASDILDVIASRTTDYGYMVPPFLNILLNSAYFLVCAGAFFSMARYIHSFVRNNLSDRYMRFLSVMCVIYVSIMVINIFTGWVFTFTSEGVYTHGPIYPVIFVLQIMTNLMSVILIFSYRKNLERRQVAAIWLFMLIIVGGFLLQVVFFQKTLLICYMFSLAAMTMLFVIETPDYLKLSQMMDELEKQTKLADAANEAKSNFLANVSHEIRTPMNAIVGMDEMILRESEDDRIKRYAGDIKSACYTLLSIINDILDLSKIESGKMELVPVEYDMSSVINDVVNMTEHKAKDKGLIFELFVEDNVPSVLYGDEIRVRQVMMNLINNAVKYTSVGKVSVKIGFDHKKSHLRVSVSDTGMGIKKEDMEKLFESFQRLDETKNRNVEGTGLGLNITKNLIEMMGGFITVESEYGKGSVFTFEIVQQVINDTPIGDYNSRLEAARKAEDDHHANLYAPRARVLIVDDNEMNLEVITGLMEETGMQITTALSGRESIEILANNSFQIIFMDQMMPGMSGTEALKQIRNEHLCDDTPVIALTADAIVGARENYISEGFADYLAKPIMYPELEEMLKKYIPDDLKEKQKEKQVMLAVCRTPERLRQVKRILPKQYKGVFVRSNDQAEKYMKDHEVSFVIMDYETEKAKRE